MFLGRNVPMRVEAMRVAGDQKQLAGAVSLREFRCFRPRRFGGSCVTGDRRGCRFRRGSLRRKRTRPDVGARLLFWIRAGRRRRFVAFKEKGGDFQALWLCRHSLVSRWPDRVHSDWEKFSAPGAVTQPRKSKTNVFGHETVHRPDGWAGAWAVRKSVRQEGEGAILGRNSNTRLL